MNFKQKNKRKTLVLRSIKEINMLLGYVDRFSLGELIQKYNVDKYVKEFKTVDLIKIAILYYYSKEKHLKHFLDALCNNKIACKLFGINQTSVQHVYKALQNRCWLFFYEAFYQVVQELKNQKQPAHRLFKGKEIKIIDSTFLVYALSRIFFAKIGYNSSEKEYNSGIKLHVLFDYSSDMIESFIETSGNVHDSKVCDTLLKEVKNCILLIDKGYQNIDRLTKLSKKNVTVIIPLRQKLRFEVIDEKTLVYEAGNINIKTIKLSNDLIVQYVNNSGFELICTDLSLQWYEIISLYSFRWDIEKLFKKLKQTWRINKPLFRNQNSIMAFICITLIAMVVMEKIATIEGINLTELNHTVGRKIEACLVVNN